MRMYQYFCCILTASDWITLSGDVMKESAQLALSWLRSHSVEVTFCSRLSMFLCSFYIVVVVIIVL